jgi:hypothetical protein
MIEDTDHNLPLSEQFRLVAKKFVDAQAAASLMEETKSAVLSQITANIIGYNIDMSYNKAEMAAKSSQEYKDFIATMVDLRKKANLLKAQMEYIRMKHSEQMSYEATARSEQRL